MSGTTSYKQPECPPADQLNRLQSSALVLSGAQGCLLRVSEGRRQEAGGRGRISNLPGYSECSA